jgi:glycogen operon protein
MTDEDWDSGFAKSLGVTLDGDAITETDARGGPIRGETFLLVFNAHYESLDFCMPDSGARWVRVLDTADSFNEGDTPAAGEAAPIQARSIAVFRRAA